MNEQKQEAGGIKHDDLKNPLDLLSPFAIEEVGKVLSFGKRKYAARNWEKGIAFTRILGAILRHTFAYMRGETHDPETGLSHMAHVMCEAMFILHFEKTKPDMDDRPVYGPIEEEKEEQKSVSILTGTPFDWGV